MILVSNTSPISNLAKVGQLSLMPQLYGRILIPCAVHEELLDLRAGNTVITAVRSATWMDIQSVQNHSLVNNLKKGLSSRTKVFGTGQSFVNATLISFRQRFQLFWNSGDSTVYLCPTT
ncbi:hypothetical protein [Coleofasciculus sp. D1-CHI-01]|uniref:hypothetical protein n=1 Tax=Coleofasciculus sp. D1-CHI-01 TaxID=3068482 RepID=UPI0040639589